MIIFITYLFIINILLFLLMRTDKQRAQKNRRRIPEKYLLALGLLGGGIGGLISMRRYRHKTKHGYFSFIFAAGAVLSVALLYYLKK